MDKALFKIDSVDQLSVMMTEIRALHKGFLTNFYLDSAKHSVWILKGDCSAERIAETLFIVKASPSFWNVFFCSTSSEQLVKDLQVFRCNHQGQTMVFDIVGREGQCLPIVDRLKSEGCLEITSLVRMMRLAEPLEFIPDPSVRKATEKDISSLSRLLHTFFDARTEQIPYDEELCAYASYGHVLVCEELGKVSGFLIYEQNATTLHLRYWFTDPSSRDTKVGSRLIRRCLDDGKETKRQLLWVIRSNDNAVKRYRHYGFREENMFDFVLQLNN